MIITTSSSVISLSAAVEPTSGEDSVSAPTSSILAPPMDLTPPLALISAPSIALKRSPAVIVLSIRVGKASKKRLEIENDVYAQRVNDMISLDIEREKVMIEREKVTNDILRQSNSQENKPEAPKTINCEYCGNINDANAERCSVCGALLRK